MNSRFMEEAINVALLGIKQGYGPFGAVVVKNDEILGRGNNRVTSSNDPTAHAEMIAIREACSVIKNFSLSGCEIYTSCEPCPMCLGAIFWARIKSVYYGATRKDAQKAHFDDHVFYEEMKKPPRTRGTPMIELMRTDSLKIFDAWGAHEKKTPY